MPEQPGEFIKHIIIERYDGKEWMVQYRPDLTKRDGHDDGDWYIDDDGDGFIDHGPYFTALDAVEAAFDLSGRNATP